MLLISSLILYLYSCNKKTIEPKEFGIQPIEPEMILIDKDLTFTYGESWHACPIDTFYTITLEPYYIGKYEITNQEYFQFILDKGYENHEYWSDEGWNAKAKYNWKKPGNWAEYDLLWLTDAKSNRPDSPVHNISFYEAEAYCGWLRHKTGKNYKIPTSAQWQRAAKGPDPGRKYPWGDEWIDDYSNPFDTKTTFLVPVNTIPEGKSYDGCYHMVGNAYEYVILLNLNPFYYGDGSWAGFCSSPDINLNPWTTTTMSIHRTKKYFNGHNYGRGFRVCID